MANTSKQDVGKKGKEPGAGEAKSAYENLLAELHQQEGLRTDWAENIAKNWQKLAGGLALGILCLVLVTKYRAIQAEREGEASLRLSEVQEQLSGKAGADLLQGPEAPQPGKEGAPADTPQADNLGANLKLLEETYDNTVYGELARLYEARRFLDQGDSSRARALLTSYGQLEFRAAAKDKASAFRPEQLVRELGALLYAKTLLVDPAAAEEGKDKLRRLAEGAAVVAPEALAALFRLAQTDSQKAEVLDIAKKRISGSPALAEAIRSDMTRLGVAGEL